MPKINTDGMLDRIIHRFGLKRSQASRQLRAWKLIKYDNAQVEIVLNLEDIEISIMEGISMELEEYVVVFFATIHEGREVPGCVDATNYCRSIKTLHKADAKSWLVKYIHNNPTHEFTAIFVHLLKRWASLAAESFPKCAKNMSDDELDFSVAVKQVQIICLNGQSRAVTTNLAFAFQSSPSALRITVWQVCVHNEKARWFALDITSSLFLYTYEICGNLSTFLTSWKLLTEVRASRVMDQLIISGATLRPVVLPPFLYTSIRR